MFPQTERERPKSRLTLWFEAQANLPAFPGHSQAAGCRSQYLF